MKRLVITWTLLTIAGMALAADPPEYINYQGVLRDADDHPLAGDYDMVFRFFDHSAGGDEILIDEHFASGTGAVIVDRGMFNVHLGGGKIHDGAAVLPGDPYDSMSKLFAGFTDVWMQIEVDAGGGSFETLLPRVRVVAAPYALNAARLGGSDAAGYVDTSATAQAKSGDLSVNELTVTGDAIHMASGGLIEGGSYFNRIRGNEITDRLELYAGAGYSQGFIELAGNSLFTFASAIGEFAFTNAISAEDRAHLYNDGDFEIVGDMTAGGSDFVLGAGGRLSGTATYNWLRGDAATDALHLYAGSAPEQGSISIFGNGNIDLRSGGGSTRFGASDGTILASIDATGNLNINGELEVGITTTNDTITFGGAESLTWDAGQTRFELSDELAAGLLNIGSTSGDLVPYNRMGSGTTSVPDDLLNNYDLYVVSDVEVGDVLYVGQTVVVGDSTPQYEQAFSSFGSGTKDEAEISTGDDVYVSDDLEVDGTVYAVRYSAPQHMHVMLDSDNNLLGARFRWYHNGVETSGTLSAELVDWGDLLLGGALYEYQFDVAESFLAMEPVGPGDLVAIDPRRPDGVRPTATAGDPMVLGVVSARPGVVLGGPPFCREALRESWGEAVLEEFVARESGLAERVLREVPRLASEVEAIAVLEEKALGAIEAAGTTEAPERADLDAEIEARRRRLADEVEGEALRLFYDERFVQVALSGRVEVKVDGSFGEILPGDPLTPSPIPGVAMKANAAGPIVGYALEPFSGGRGEILVFVSREQYTPGDEIASIRDNQQELSERVERGTPDPETGTQSLAGNMQVLLDGDGDDEARFSIFRDGEAKELGAEVFRVDEHGNVYARGAFSPSSMDVAEFFPTAARAEPGDVLVASREIAGMLVPCSEVADPAVVGVASLAPGVLLGQGVERIAATDPELALRLEEARGFGDREAESRAWNALRDKFLETHAAVAMTGTVDVKVDAGYGAIRVGDLLTTSPTPGHAMRAEEPVAGTVVGKALEALETGTGIVRMIVMLR